MVDFEFVIERYGWFGIALLAVLLALLAVQIYCYVFRYDRISKYRNSVRPRRLDTDTPPVSVIVPLFSENIEFAETGLIRLLAQDYDDYEVIVVYVGRDTDFFDDLTRMGESFPNLRTTKIEMRPHYPISVKTACNIGIKAAHNENIILITPEASPRTNRWLALMAKGFARGEVVIGYCCAERHDNLFGRLVRIDRMMQSSEWLASAVEGRPYRGHRNNIGFTRSLYFNVNGFNHLNMNLGEDDLFMQRIMTRDNVSVVLSPRATVVERQQGGLGYLFKRRRLFRSTRRLYPKRVRWMLHLEPVSRALFFAAAVAGFATMPLEYCGVVLLLILIRYVAVALVVARIARRLGERRVSAVYPLYDLFSLGLALLDDLMSIRKDSPVWKYTSI